SRPTENSSHCRPDARAGNRVATVGRRGAGGARMIGLGIGVRSTCRIVGVIRHEQSGLLAAPAEGIIYGRTGVPVGTVCSDGYVRLGGRRGMPCQYAHRIMWAAVNGEIPDGL